MGEAKGKDKEMKTFKEISQGLKTRYYRKAVATNRHGNTQMKVDTARIFGKPGDAKKAQDRADSVRSKMATVRPAGEAKEDSDAVKAFLAKGGKITKVPAAKAQGYHGKDDPGKGMHGILDKPDTQKIGTRKKVKSMEDTDVNELSTPTLKSYLKKAGPQKDKYYSQYQKLRRGQTKKHGEFSPDMGKTKEVGRKAVNRDDGEYRAQKTLAKRGK